MASNPADQLAVVRSLREQNRQLAEENGILKQGGGGGTLPPMGEIDAKIAASEARTDTKFAKLEGKLDLIVVSLETVKSQTVDANGEARATRRTVIGTGISLGALLIAIFALYVNSFNMGSKVDDIVRAESRQTFNEMAFERSRLTASPRQAEQPVPVTSKK